mgnify:CR=1 FL=1
MIEVNIRRQVLTVSRGKREQGTGNREQGTKIITITTGIPIRYMAID